MGKWEGSIHSLGKCVLSAYVLDMRLFDTRLVRRVGQLGLAGTLVMGNKVERVDSGPAEIGCQIPNGGSPKFRWEPSGCGPEKGPFAGFSLDTDSLVYALPTSAAHRLSAPSPACC